MNVEVDSLQDDKILHNTEEIQRNAEHIRRNEEAIRRQTEAIEKIRDHYFPKRNIFKKTATFILKVVGVIALYAGLAESGDWYFNTRKTDAMACQSIAVAKKLFMHEADMAGACHFLEKASELDNGRVSTRIFLGYVKGFATIADYFDLGRPLLPEERTRVDSILAEATFLQNVAPDNAMPYVLAAQALMLRGELDEAKKSFQKAVSLEPDNVMVRVCACAISFVAHDFTTLRIHLTEAEHLDKENPFVCNWRGMFALMVEHDIPAAKEAFMEMKRVAPRHPIAHWLLGMVMMAGEKPDFEAARAYFKQALALTPNMRRVMLNMAETYVREGNLPVARLWLDRLLGQDPNFMRGLLLRARVYTQEGQDARALEDLSKAIQLDAFRADLYRSRAEVYVRLGKANEAKDDLALAVKLDQQNKGNSSVK